MRSTLALDAIRVALAADVVLLLVRAGSNGTMRVLARAGPADHVPDEIPAPAGVLLEAAVAGIASAVLSGLSLAGDDGTHHEAFGPSLVVPVDHPRGGRVLVVARRRTGAAFDTADLDQAMRLVATATPSAARTPPDLLTDLGGDGTVRRAFEAAAVGMSLVDHDLRYRWVNAPLCVMLDRTAEELLGLAAVDTVHPDYVERALAFYDRLRQRDFGAVRGRLMFRRPDGSPVWAELGGSAVNHNGNGPLFLVHQFDITAEQGTAEEYAYRAMHDDLTGLANRALLRDRLQASLAHNHRASTRTVVFYLDIDRFKAVNDEFGHATGDLVLRETAARLAGVVRAGDTVARVGGDEFVVAGEASGVAEANRLADRVGTALRPSIDIGRMQLRVAVSIGVALDGPGDNPDDIVSRADRALLRAKRLPSLHLLSEEPLGC